MRANAAVLTGVALAAAACGTGSGLPADMSPASRAAIEACMDRGGVDKQDCYKERLVAELASDGVRPALDMLSEVAASDVDVERDAHVYTHAIGMNSYDPDRPVSEVFARCTELFQSGCYHGVIQAYFMAQGTIDEATVRGLCEDFKQPGADRFLLFQCLHGLGHGLTMFYAHHLPRALKDCDLLASSWDRDSCYGGAFMENIVAATDPHHMGAEAHGVPASDTLEPWEPLRADDPLYPCSVLDSRYQVACYMMQTSAMLRQNGDDIGDAAKTCETAPQNLRKTCFQSLGRDISSHTLQNVDDGLRECGRVADEYRGWCYVGLVKNFVDLTATTDAGFHFCTRVEDTYRPRCNQAMGEEIGILFASEEDRRAACRVADSEADERSCLRGAGVAAN